MTIAIGQDAKTVYGWGTVAKVNRKSVIVTVNGQNHKVEAYAFSIMNQDASDVNDKAHRAHY